MTMNTNSVYMYIIQHIHVYIRVDAFMRTKEKYTILPWCICTVYLYIKDKFQIKKCELFCIVYILLYRGLENYGVAVFLK